MVMRMADELRFFDDEDQTKSISIVDFSRVEVGQTHVLTVYMANIDKEWPLKNIETSNMDKQLTLDFPEELEPEEVRPLVLTWKPTLNRREKLDITELFEAELWIG